jgi:hypothetical protein
MTPFGVQRLLLYFEACDSEHGLNCINGIELSVKEHGHTEDYPLLPQGYIALFQYHLPKSLPCPTPRLWFDKAGPPTQALNL